MIEDYLRDRLSKLTILVVVGLVVHLSFTVYVRPEAEAWLAEQKQYAATHPGYNPDRSLLVIIRDPEQEATIILACWALILSGMRFLELKRQRKLLNEDLMRLSPGAVILPEHVRDYVRQLDALPPKQQDAVVPRVLRSALLRFVTTGNVQDSSTFVHHMCESEGARLDAELTILRFSAWATPALGFVGTVRGIGIALQGAELAMAGDTTAVTSGLGISFNSTLVALTLSILLMYILHELQFAQERLVLDAERYVDEQLVSRLQGGRPREADLGGHVRSAVGL
jgi:biopolymer transport protein ExbB/TolQ